MKNYTKIVLAGGSGQIGTALVNFFKDKTQQLIVLTRNKTNIVENVHYLHWDAKTHGNWTEAMDGTDLLVNLVGKNVNCRYSEKNKKEIFDSRTLSIELLAKAIQHCHQKPKLWVQCASATIYRHAEDRPMTEATGEIGDGFSVEVCKKWESTFWEQTNGFQDMRKVVLRTSLVLSKREGVFPRLKNLALLGLGGRQGKGNQWVSWIHEEDVVGVIDWIYQHPEIEGTINCTAPIPVKNDHLMRVLSKRYNRILSLPSPKWLLELGAIIIGTETELVLKSRWVLPQFLIDHHYKFKFPEIRKAILHLSNL